MPPYIVMLFFSLLTASCTVNGEEAEFICVGALGAPFWYHSGEKIPTNYRGSESVYSTEHNTLRVSCEERFHLTHLTCIEEDITLHFIMKVLPAPTTAHLTRAMQPSTEGISNKAITNYLSKTIMVFIFTALYLL